MEILPLIDALDLPFAMVVASWLLFKQDKILNKVHFEITLIREMVHKKLNGGANGR